jgi:hypothetical protein
MLYSRPAPGWKRVDIEYFSLDRLEAYPTLRLLCKVDAFTRKFWAFVPSATLAIMEAFGATVGFLMLLWILFCGVYAILICFILFILYAIMKNTKRTADLLEQMESFQKPFSVRLLGDRGASSATSASFRLRRDALLTYPNGITTQPARARLQRRNGSRWSRSPGYAGRRDKPLAGRNKRALWPANPPSYPRTICDR